MAEAVYTPGLIRKDLSHRLAHVEPLKFCVSSGIIFCFFLLMQRPGFTVGSASNIPERASLAAFTVTQSLFTPFRIARGSGVAPLFSFSSHVRHHADASTEHLGKSTQKQVPRWWRPQVEVITKTLRLWVMPTIYFFREYRSRLK